MNSQSGKGGVAYIMKAEHGFDLPRRLQIEFSKTIQAITEDSGTEIAPGAMWDAFQGEYLPEAPAIVLESQELRSDREGRTTITAQLVVDGEHRTVTGDGNGPIDAFVRGVRRELGLDVDVVDYAEHASARGPTPRRWPTSRRSAPTGRAAGGSGPTPTSSPPRSGPWCPRSCVGGGRNLARWHGLCVGSSSWPCWARPSRPPCGP